jgi:hypothetical protein
VLVALGAPSICANCISTPRARRSLSAREVPGGHIRKTLNVPSWNEGRNELPNVVASAIASTASAPDAASTRPRLARHRSRIGWYLRLSHLASAPSPPWPSDPDAARAAPGVPKTSLHSAGVTVSATSSDAMIDTM